MHRDIKPENILFKKIEFLNDNNKLEAQIVIKIADFGTSKYI